MKFCKECGLRLGIFNRSGYCNNHKPEVTTIVITPNDGSAKTTITITPNSR